MKIILYLNQKKNIKNYIKIIIEKIYCIFQKYINIKYLFRQKKWIINILLTNMNIENNIFCLIYNIFDNIKVWYIFLILIYYIYII